MDSKGIKAGDEVRVVFDYEGRMVQWGTNRHGVVTAAPYAGAQAGWTFVPVEFIDGRTANVDARVLADDTGYRAGE